MSTGAAIRKITSSGTAHASSRGREQTMTTKSATTHPSHALRVNVSSSAKVESNAGASIQSFRS